MHVLNVLDPFRMLSMRIWCFQSSLQAPGPMSPTCVWFSIPYLSILVLSILSTCTWSSVSFLSN
jgi:hypothetical protein